MNRNMMTSPGALRTQHWLTAQLSPKELTVQPAKCEGLELKEKPLSVLQKKKKINRENGQTP